MATSDTAPSIPVKLLFEGIEHTVTVEMKNGESYRGKLVDAEASMNLQMRDVLHTARNGQKKKLEYVFVRGGNVKLIVFPSILKEATVFRKVATMKTKFDKVQEAKEASARGRGRGSRAR